MNRDNRRQMIRSARYRRGLTLIELLVVIGVIGLLLIVLIPGCANDHGRNSRANCSSNMRNVAIAVGTYSTQHAEALPVGIYKTSRYTAQSAILGQLEMANLLKVFGTFTGTADRSSNVTKIKVPIFNCPSDMPSGTYQSPGGGTYARSSFVFCFGAGTMEPPAANDLGVLRVGTTSSFTVTAIDGAMNTVLLSETISGKTADDPSGAWGYGEAGSCGYTHKNLPVSGVGLAPIVANSATDFSNAVATASSMHSGIVNVIYADMHSASIATTVDPAIWRAMATANGHEKYTAP